MSTFSDMFILSMNHRLSYGDLKMLDKLCEKYTPWELHNRILEGDIEQILSRLILNRLPFNVGQRLITNNGTLYSKIVIFGQDKLIPNGEEHIGQSYINKEIEKMNEVLYEC